MKASILSLMQEETVPMLFVAFGITGDLMRHKILPALGALHSKGALPVNFSVIGVSRRNWSDAQLRAYIAEALGSMPAGFVSRFFMLQGDSADPSLHASLVAKLQEQGMNNRTRVLFYLSIAPDLYEPVIAGIAKLQLAPTADDWPRICIEKPFGTDASSAQRLNRLLSRSFAEEQIYRIDHYAGKDMARTLAQNRIRNIQSITIRILEKAGVEDRAVLYGRLGALRDVGQNHMLQLLALALAGDRHSPAQRAEVLRLLPMLKPEEIAQGTIRAQYEGYRTIPGVDPQSQTETYFKINFSILQGDGSKIGVTFEGGKCLPQSIKEVVIETAGGQKYVFTDTPGPESEYERLLNDCLAGNHEWCINMPEVEAQWRFIDPILNAWCSGVPPLDTYLPGNSPKTKNGV